MKRRAMDETHSFDLNRGPKQRATSATALSTSLSPLFPVPLEILEEIFLNLPPDQVVCICRLVCHQWKEVADSESLWRERCRREGYHLCGASKILKDWRLFYFLCKKRRNLLKNPRGEQGLNDWKILENGGDRWRVFDLRVAHPDETVEKDFVTSYSMCRKSQLIDLEKEGYDPSFMDHFKPDIRISDWYIPRIDCGSKYEICVELLNQSKKPVQTFAPKTVYFKYAPRMDCGSLYEICVELLNQRKKAIQTFAPETVYFQYGAIEKWNQMTHVFQNYGPGVRYIRFTHGGKDIQFWKGWYGIRVTDSCVEICPAKDT